MSVSWLARRTARPNAHTRLVCFPHSGGSIGEFLRWGDALQDIEVWGVQLPGRGARIAEDAIHRLGPLVEAIVEQARLPEGFGFFGHSLGALVAFEVARALRDLGRAGPRFIVASALPAPHLPLGVEPVSGLSDEALLASLTGVYGSIADEIRADPDLREVVLPGLRADLEIAESYRYAEAEPLDCPIVAVGGEDDAISLSELEAWRRHTTGPFELRAVPGGHFYFRDDPAPLCAVIRAAATPSSSSPSASAVDHPSRAAEASRAGFLGNLFAGRLRWDLISPFPRSPATGDAVVEEMTRAVRELVDPEEVERTGALPDGYVDALRARRLLSLGMPPAAGGRGLSYFDVFRVVHAAMSWSLPAGYVVAVHNGIGAGAILDAIPEGATKEYVRSAVAAGALSGWADTEATGAGNRMPLTRARPSDDGEAYLLDGEKFYTVNASIANLLVVSATLPNDAGEDESRVFFVDTCTPGFRVASLHELMGIRGLPMARTSYDGVRVPKDRLLAGDEGHWRLTSLLEPLSALGRMYIVVASSLATADRCVAWSRDFVQRRQVDGRPIASYEAIQRLAAGNAADAYAMETVACFCLAGIDLARLSLRWFEQVAAKNVASMICARVVDRTMSLFAAEGYETAASKRRRGGPPLAVERAYRDARAFRIAGGVEFLIDFVAARTAIFATYYASDAGVGADAASASETVAEGAQPGGGGRNQAHARFVREAVERFGRTCRAMSERWPRASELFVRQHALVLANQIANELFTMAAVLARSAEGDEHAKDLADVFCVDARHRVEDAFQRLAAADEGGPDWARVVDAWLSRGGREPPLL